ncbi:MAG: hypothetical protein GX644_17580 [Limnobacter sp.]|nr:hypothetical protein [Limnobacter sp.]
MSVTATAVHPYPKTLHPIHATLLAGTVPLFLGALLSDLAYRSSYEVQWANFASWLIAGGLVFAGLALLAALAGLFRSRGGERRPIYFLLLLAIWILGFVNALVHARDAWAAMPTGLVLSAIVAALSIVATGVGLSRRVGAPA